MERATLRADGQGFRAVRKHGYKLYKKRTDVNSNKNWVELVVKIVVAALTAALTALTTTSCMGRGPIGFLSMM